MIPKNFAIGIAIISFSVVSLIVFLTTSYAINPAAALTAITVAIVGLFWFKKQDLQKRR
jgi:4-hydroxybenzoate polyprenyltransferase